IIRNLQRLHQDLRSFNAPPIPARYDILANTKVKRSSIFERIFGGSSARRTGSSEIPENVPRGLYLYGDVGSGKTMLMDLLYETLPKNVTSKLRVHFHNFMQDVHKRLHNLKIEHGTDIDGVPLIAADIAVKANVLCFDEFQCTDVADAMILRRFIEALMSFGVVLITTSNRHPDDLYLNGIQRESFIPCIQLLKGRLDVINLDSTIDYRKLPRPTSGVYYSPLGASAAAHAEKWFKYLGDTSLHSPKSEVLTVWGRDIVVPKVSGKAAMFTFDDLIGRPKSAADYIELTKHYDAFVLTNIPMMSHRERDLARRFITFIDAVYEARCKLVLTSAVHVDRLFVSKEEAAESRLITGKCSKNLKEGRDLSDDMRNLMDDLGMSPKAVKNSNIFSGDEEQFAFARALSRLSEMGSREWIQRESDDSRILKSSNDVAGVTL
ncbi:Bgt-425, partial [Blumeria graminis f. sp. tritici]